MGKFKLLCATLIIITLLRPSAVLADTRVKDFETSTDLATNKVTCDKRNGVMICEITDAKAYHGTNSLRLKSTLDPSTSGANSIYMCHLRYSTCHYPFFFMQ